MGQTKKALDIEAEEKKNELKTRNPYGHPDMNTKNKSWTEQFTTNITEDAEMGPTYYC